MIPGSWGCALADMCSARIVGIRAFRSAFGVAVLLVISACPKTETADAGREEWADAASEFTGDSGAAVDAGATPLKFSFQFRQADGGVTVVSEPFRPQDFDSLVGFEVSADGPAADIRIRVIDWADRVVASDDSQSLDGGLFNYSATFVEPLRTGRRYQLLIDSQSGTDAEFEDLELPIQIRGEIAPEPGSRSKPKPKKRR